MPIEKLMTHVKQAFFDMLMKKYLEKILPPYMKRSSVFLLIPVH